MPPQEGGWREESKRRYFYYYKSEAPETPIPAEQAPQMKVLFSIRDSISLLTGSCEVCKHSEGGRCVKHGRPIHEGDPRCEDFARRFESDLEDKNRERVKDYINEVLGVKDPAMQKRLLG